MGKFLGSKKTLKLDKGFEEMELWVADREKQTNLENASNLINRLFLVCRKE